MTEFSAKDTVKKYLETLPNDLSVEELAYCIFFEEKLKKVNSKHLKEKIIQKEEAEAYLEKWL